MGRKGSKEGRQASVEVPDVVIVASVSVTVNAATSPSSVRNSTVMVFAVEAAHASSPKTAVHKE